MALPGTTTQTQHRGLAGTSSLLEIMHLNEPSNYQEFGNTWKRDGVSTGTAGLHFGEESTFMFVGPDAMKWLESYSRLRDTNETQLPTAQIVGLGNKWRILGGYPQRQRIPWKKHIAEATKQEEIVAILRLFELDAIADRLGYLQRTIADDPDEQPLTFESLRGLALFLMSERQLPYPQIAISPEGNAQIEWRVGENGILAMEFLPVDGLIRFAAISAPAKLGVQRNKVYGTLPKEDALNAVKAFTSEISTQ